MTVRTFSTLIENVGAEVGDFKLAKVNVGTAKGNLRYVRVQATTAPDTSFEIAVWRVNRTGVFDPESPECIYWRKSITAAKSWMAGDQLSIQFAVTGTGLANELLVGIRATTAAATDDYLIELDVEPDDRRY